MKKIITLILVLTINTIYAQRLDYILSSQNTFRMIMNYDENDNCLSMIEQFRDTPSDSWEGDMGVHCIYDDNENIISIIKKEVNRYKTDFTYENGEISETTLYVYDDDDDQWIQMATGSYTYDVNGNLIEVFENHTEVILSSGEIISYNGMKKEEYTYNINNNKTTYKKSLNNASTNNEWELLREETYSYNFDDKLILVEDNDSKTEFTYTEEGNIFEETSSYLEDGIWVLSYKFDYTYNTNISEDELILPNHFMLEYLFDGDYYTFHHKIINWNFYDWNNTENDWDVDGTLNFIYSPNNQIIGNIKFDLNNNGCDNSDVPVSNLLLITNNGTENFSTFTQNNGDYFMSTNEGNFTTEVTTNLPSYFTTNPTSQVNTFIGFDNIFTADFCIQPNQTVNDVNINLIPTTQARPGFNTTYQIIYRNVGTTQLNGNVTLEFDETKLSFSNASETISSQTSNTLTFDYSNLNPFETRMIDLEFNVSVPPTTEIDDILNFITTINPITSDYTTDDNIFELNQTVVGSYDPNDITCLEGNQVLFTDKDKYLHYIIRFQNTGTASAINVVVKNILDNHLDWSTLQLENLSHNNRVAIKNGNEIEFIFENIDLPDSTTDEPNSHGFIAYKIKPKTDIALDDIILSKADIFFDYNSPIETNTASTRIVNVLAVNENTLLDFSAYPTPTKNILNIKSKTEISKIEIYSKLGQLILKNETENNIDISNLTNGLYFVKVEDINGNFGVKKIMKK